jgi:hypothetical protein
MIKEVHNLYKINYEEVAIDLNKKYETSYHDGYLSKLDRMVLKQKSSLTRERIKSIAYGKDGKPKKKYLIVDYRKVSKAVSMIVGKVHQPVYLKRIHLGVYKSARILRAIEKVLSDYENAKQDT